MVNVIVQLLVIIEANKVCADVTGEAGDMRGGEVTSRTD